MATRLYVLLSALAVAYADYISARRASEQCLVTGDDFEYHQWYSDKAREEVRDEMKWIWSLYRERALGSDTLLPEEGYAYETWGGLNLFLIESMDTLHLMGFESWFQEAKKYVKTYSYFRKNININVMEVNIRVLGGLISAYELSPDPGLLRRMVELGDRLALAFKLRGILPYSDLNMETGEYQLLRNMTGVSEMASFSLEFRKLSEISGNRTYAELVDKVERFLLVKLVQSGGLLRYEYDPYKNEFIGRKCVGAREDSFYEYIYKVWLMTGRQKAKYRTIYALSKTAILKTLLEKSASGEVYLKEIQDNGQDAYIMEHLACFYPGLLALENILEGYNATEVKIAEDLTKTCISWYANTVRHLAPDLAVYPQNHKLYVPKEHASYHLRPETVESAFYLWRLTKDQYYRDAAYSIFAAIRRNAKAEFGYSSVKDVTDTDALEKLNEQPSYFTSETLKYLFLTFTKDDFFDLKDYVFSTEGHIFRVEKPKGKE